MVNHKLVLSFFFTLLGSCIAFYCGVGSLFILGDYDPRYHPMGYAFIGIALCGAALFVIGLRGIVRNYRKD